ncbi:plastocyanin/azurin family copper-binding protein [Paenibacillus sp. OV219]|uniref:plastocyanin/azurin family copper-binding protein n=1 Tax=Paenibacillus sp. OV219 TaxID=1884377 RepID=UPI0008B55608|nr:plastocyanin/azurin family copper-binding protein [Paenibacillus sp. OV219]SEM63058.1 Plastocyanin [Paenibacillus sp. OV219]
MKFIRIMLLVAILALTGVTGAFAADANAPQAWGVSVGKMMSKDTEMFSMQPGVIYIHEGDTVKFTNNDMAAPHLLGFLIGNPPPGEDFDITKFSPASGSSWAGDTMLFSPEMHPMQSYSITFTKAGAYAYYCLIHPIMKGTVVVLPSGSLLPSKAEQAAVNNALIDDQTKVAADWKTLNGKVNYDKNKDGTLTYKVLAGMGNTQVMVNAFLPGEVYINAGDTIQWLAGAPGEAHTAVVNAPKGMQVFTEKGVNPDVVTPHSPVYDGKGFASAGVLMLNVPDFGSPSFKLTFTKPGTYTVTDVLWGYTGKIIVAPKGAVKLTVNDKAVVTTTLLKNGHVFAPLSSVAKALGASYQVSGKTVLVGGKKLVATADTTPYVSKGVTYIAVESVAQLLGKTYTWDQTAKLLSIRTK